MTRNFEHYQGIVRHGHSLLYGVNHGFGRRWLPERVQRWIVHTWNAVTCHLYGHDDILWHLYQDDYVASAECVNCVRPLAGCTGVGRYHERAAA